MAYSLNHAQVNGMITEQVKLIKKKSGQFPQRRGLKVPLDMDADELSQRPGLKSLEEEEADGFPQRTRLRSLEKEVNEFPQRQGLKSSETRANKPPHPRDLRRGSGLTPQPSRTIPWKRDGTLARQSPTIPELIVVSEPDDIPFEELTSYVYDDVAGAGVSIFIVDTGINAAHPASSPTRPSSDRS
jgi:subtilisin family serine protease